MGAARDLARFRRSFWLPPRAHGQLIRDRRVSFLELFYDLVYVVVVSQAAHHLAEHISWGAAGQFAIVFGLVWIAWLNGAAYHELHGHDDGRTRTYVFLQMAILALLAVFTANATGDDGRAFALVYCAFLVVLMWLWYTVRRQDDERFRPVTTPYLVGMGTSIVIVGASAFVPPPLRVTLWAVVVGGWVVGLLVLTWASGTSTDSALEDTESLIERLDLFTIIVLGEVVVGVVNGIAEADRTPMAITTGMVGLMIGFAYWWTYFDFVGGRRVRLSRGAFARWNLGHLPITMSIAASGAVLAGLIEHAEDTRTPETIAHVLVVTVVVGLGALVLTMSSLDDWVRLARVYHPVAWSIAVAAAVALVVGWLRPAPWLLAAILVAELMAVWFFAIFRWLKTTGPDEPIPALHRP